MKNKAKDYLDKRVSNLLISDEQVASRRRCRQIFGDPSPPPLVWERQFDYCDDKLREIAAKEWWEIQEEDLWYYLLDLAYVELQADLFRYLFPVCLAFWYDTLLRNEMADRGDSEFHYALRRGNILGRMTTPDETRQILEFFQDAMIERISQERAVGGKGLQLETSAFSWIMRFNSLGQVAPVIEPIWVRWWTFDHPGKAVGAIIYASGLVYLKGENPFFPRSANQCNQGYGGGPSLTENDSQLYDGVWLEENLRFLKDRLSVAYILGKLSEAAEVLRLESEAPLAEKILTDAQERQDIIAIRIEDLLWGLAHSSGASMWDE